jgi:AsmA protein
MRKLKIFAAIAVAAILLIVLGVWLFLDPNNFRGQIQARLEQQLHRKVTLGQMSLGLLPVRFSVQDLTVADDPSFQASLPFVQAKQLDVRVSLLRLLTGTIQVDSLDLQQPSVELIRNNQGKWNFASLTPAAPSAPVSGPAPEVSAPSGETPAKVPESKPSAFSLRRLSIQGGKIAITDQLKNQPRTVYEPIDVSLRDYKQGQPFSFDVTAHIPGQGSQEIKVKGTGGPLPDAGPAAMPLKATVSLNSIDVAGLRKFLDSEYLSKAEGSLSGETQLESQSGKMAGKGKLNFANAKIGGVEVGYPIALDYDLSSDVAAGIVQIASATLKLGETPLAVAGTINTNPTPIEVDLHLKTGEVSIAEAARLASAFGIAFSPDTTVTGKMLGDVRARGPFSKLALNGTLSGRSLQISGKSLPQPVSVNQLDLSLTPNEIQSNEFEARTGKTTVIGRVGIRQYTSKTPIIDTALRAPGATLPEIQTIASAYGLTGLQQLSGPGNLSFDLRATGPLESVASANVMRALNGKINLNFDMMKIQGVDASRELARIGGFLKSDTTDRGFTEVLKLAGNIGVTNGVAQTNDLEARLAEGTLAASGKADLATQQLDLRGAAIFSKGYSDKVGGTTIGGYLTTALSNDKGELVIPVIITGDMKKPKFLPDAQALLKMQRDRLLPGLDDPRKALSNILDGLSGKKKTEEQGSKQGEQPKPNPLRDALEGIFGGKK